MIESGSPFLFRVCLFLRPHRFTSPCNFAVLPWQAEQVSRTSTAFIRKEVLSTGLQAHVFLLHPLKSLSLKGRRSVQSLVFSTQATAQCFSHHLIP